MTVDSQYDEYGLVSTDYFLARVTHVDASNGKAYFRSQSGSYGFTTDDSLNLRTEDVILVDQNKDICIVAPKKLLEKESWIGVVRSTNAKDTLVSDGRLLRRVPTRKSKKYKVGNTVLAREDYGVVRVVYEKPVDASNSLQDILDEENFADSIRMEPSKEGPQYADFAGYDGLKHQVQGFIRDSLVDREALSKLGAKPGKGVLFTGSPGTGKTFLASIVANEEGATFYPVKGPEVVNKYYGQTETFLRQIFDDAKKQSKAIIFFDELDSIATSRDELTHDFSRSVVTQLLTLLDGHESDNIFVIGTSNRVGSIDSALKRPGRLDKVIEFHPPDEEGRMAILLTYIAKNTVENQLPFEIVAKQTSGWTPAELASIWQAAARCAVREGRKSVTSEDYRRGFEQAQFERTQVSRSNHVRQTEGKHQS